MKARRLYLIGISLYLSCAGSARVTDEDSTIHVQTLRFSGDPLSVQLNIGREMRVVFDQPVTLSLPVSTLNHIELRNIENTLFVKALKPFDSVRTIVHLQHSKQSIVLALTAINRDTAYVNRIQTLDQIGPISNAKPMTISQLLQHVTAYLIHRRHRSSEFTGSLHVRYLSPTSSPVLTCDQIETLPLFSWQSASLYAHVVRLKHIGNAPLELNPEMIHGKWLAVGVFDRHLDPRTASSYGYLVLVSRASFSESLKS